MGGDVNRPRAADDFATIRARMEELRREREGGQNAEEALTAEPVPFQVNRIGRVAMAVGRLRRAPGRADRAGPANDADRAADLDRPPKRRAIRAGAPV